MTDIEQTVVSQTKDLVDGKNEGHELLSTLLSLDRENITGKAAIRYLIQTQKWEMSLTNPMGEAMAHLFATYKGKPEMEPEVYQAQTKQLIQELWGYECIVMVPPKPVVVEKTVKEKAPPKKAAPKPGKPVRTIATKTSEETSDIDTKGASDRLKKVISIQRGS